MTENNVVPFTPRQRPRRAKPRRKPTSAGTPISALIDSWELKLRAANKAQTTIALYLRSANRFTAYLAAERLPEDAESITAREVRLFLVAEQERAGVPTAVAHHNYLGVWFKWMIAEEERTTFSPVLREDRPHMPRKARKYLTVEQVGALLHVCKGNDFASRRDTAIIMTFFDNGMRVGGLAGMRVEDVDLKGQRLRIVLKGGDEHWVPIGRATAQAIDRYLRVRSKHLAVDSPWLWLGIKSIRKPRFTYSGVETMLHRRGEQAGIENVHPHRFRGSSAHELLKAGADAEDVKRILGWKSDAMLRHYTEDLAVERAAAAHQRFSPSDRV